MRNILPRLAVLVMAVLAGAGTVTAALAQPPAERGQPGRGQGPQGRGGGGPPRDIAPGRQLPMGTAILSGIVAVAGTGQPARRAVITLNSTEGGGARTVTTDEEGRFVFTGLPAGRYNLSVTKAGHVAVIYGQTYPGRPGTPIQLAEGDKFAAHLQLPRGSVLTGTVLDEYGDPAPGTAVRAMRFVTQGGRRTLQQSGTASTDDRGIYRIFGLQPGEYIVSAVPRHLAPAGNFGRARATAERLAATAIGSDGALSPEIARRAEMLQAQLPPQDEAQSGYAPVYYPGTVAAAQAGSITLGIGEERSSIDIQLQRVAMARIEGVVVNLTGQPVQNVQLTLSDATQSVPGIGGNSARADADGRFRMINVPPGNYRLVARSMVVSQPAGAEAPAGGRGGRGNVQPVNPTRLWGGVDVPVDGRDLTNIVVTLQQGLDVSGRIAFDGMTQPPDPTRVRVNLAPADPAAAGFLQRSSGTVDATGKFSIRSVLPGMYRLTASGAGSGWVLASATVEGQDALDFPLEVKAGSGLANVLITFTDRAAQLAGTITNQRGEPAPGFTLILYSADEQYWIPQSRRIRATRPATTGQFTFAGVPAGEYRLAALVDVEPGAWFDPAFLQQLDAASMRITIGEGENKVQNLQVGNP